MRMRKKKHGAERLETFREYLVSGSDDLPAAPFALEIGCGKGAFIAETAIRHPEMRFLAVERISDVLLAAAEKVSAAGLTPDRVRLAVADADRLGEIISPGTVSRIYLNFSDPWPKARHAKRRLTHRERLKKYASYLCPGGEIEFKTDNDGIFEFTIEELSAAGFKITYITRDLHESGRAAGNVMTEYEKIFSEKGFKIKMLSARPAGQKTGEKEDD